MSIPSQTATIGSLVDGAAHSADHAIRSSQRMADNALDQLAGQVESARTTVGPALAGLSQDASALVQRGRDAIAQGGEQFMSQARSIQTSTRSYIEQEPMKAVLIAMAAGAALVVLGGLLSRGRGTR